MIQLTYEGLIDELFGIKNGFFTPTFPCIPDAKPGQKKVLLNSSDTVFKLIRDLNQSFVGTQLKQKAKNIEAEIEQRKNLQTVADIKDFTKKLPRLQEEKKNLEMRNYSKLIMFTKNRH